MNRFAFYKNCLADINSLSLHMICPVCLLIETGAVFYIGVTDGIADSTMLFWSKAMLN
jgi:hypothetical protein